jgi:hypothetical protein
VTSASTLGQVFKMVYCRLPLQPATESKITPTAEL